jgi:hypothetical protein
MFFMASISVKMRHVMTTSTPLSSEISSSDTLLTSTGAIFTPRFLSSRYSGLSMEAGRASAVRF